MSASLPAASAGSEIVPWDIEAHQAVGILIAALGGAAVGLEREWSGHASGPEAHFAGIRTFTMLGALAGISGWLWLSEMELLAGILLLGGVAVIVAAYAAASRRGADATTEVAALIVLGAGLLAGTNHSGLASSTVVLTTLLLEEKSRLHAIVRRIDQAGLRASLMFAVMALVILPLLPPGPYGPWGGVRPRLIWAMVLFFSGLSFAGFIARRLAGPRTGYLVSGILGGLVSSTSVALAFARQSRDTKEPAAPLAVGVVAASLVSLVRVLFATTILNPSLAVELLPLIAVPLLAGGATVYFTGKRSTEDTSALEAPKNPLQFLSALEMALLFQVVLFGVYLAHRYWAQWGILASGAVLGFADLDALTFSMAKGAPDSFSYEIAAKALAIGMLSNTFLKLGVGFVIGSQKFRRLTAMGLATMAVALAGSLAWLR